MAHAVSYFPRPLQVDVLPVLFPKDEREFLLALIGTSHPLLPVNEQGQRALATLRISLLGVLRFGERIDDELLTRTADLVTSGLRERYPLAQCWRGGLAGPVVWGLLHLASRFHMFASTARGRWAGRLHRAAHEAELLADVIDIAAGGSVSGGIDPAAPPPMPTAKEIDKAWSRFERATKGVTGAFGLLILLEPPRLELGPPQRPRPTPDAGQGVPLPFGVGAGGDHAA
jgi:hypothetical protein